jgi:hypothetical protein
LRRRSVGACIVRCHAPTPVDLHRCTSRRALQTFRLQESEQCPGYKLTWNAATPLHPTQQQSSLPLESINTREHTQKGSAEDELTNQGWPPSSPFSSHSPCSAPCRANPATAATATATAAATPPRRHPRILRPRARPLIPRHRARPRPRILRPRARPLILLLPLLVLARRLPPGSGSGTTTTSAPERKAS